MAQLDDLQPVQIARGDFLYKIGEQAEWTRLPSPIDNVKHNCYGITFDHGIILTQKHPEHGSICRVKLILKPPAMELEEDLPIIRAECFEIHNPSFTARNRCTDKAKAVEHAKTLPLASLDGTITAVKLRNLSLFGPLGTILNYDHELQERIWELIERGYRAARAAQTNGGERRIWTPPAQQPSSSSEVIVDKDKPRVRLPTPQATTPPQPPNNSSEIPAHKNKPRVQLPTPQAATPRRPSTNSSEIPADKDNLSERLQAHQAATAEGEQELWRGLEYDRKAVLRAVTVAINGEWEKKLAAAETEYRAWAALAVEKIIAEGEGLGSRVR